MFVGLAERTAILLTARKHEVHTVDGDAMVVLFVCVRCEHLDGDVMSELSKRVGQ
jgi:hypothetical protein